MAGSGLTIMKSSSFLTWNYCMMLKLDGTRYIVWSSICWYFDRWVCIYLYILFIHIVKIWYAYRPSTSFSVWRCTGLQNINSQIWTGNSSMLSTRCWPSVFTQIQIYLLFIQLATQVSYTVQQIMSAESMPVLSGAVPSFEIFMTRWEKLHTKYPELKPGLTLAYSGLRSIILAWMTLMHMWLWCVSCFRVLNPILARTDNRLIDPSPQSLCHCRVGATLN